MSVIKRYDPTWTSDPVDDGPYVEASDFDDKCAEVGALEALHARSLEVCRELLAERYLLLAVVEAADTYAQGGNHTALFGALDAYHASKGDSDD